MKLMITVTSSGDGTLLSDMARSRTLNSFMRAILNKKSAFMPQDVVIYDGSKKHVIVDDGKICTRGEEYIQRMVSMPFEGGDEGSDIEISADYSLRKITVWIHKESAKA